MLTSANDNRPLPPMGLFEGFTAAIQLAERCARRASFDSEDAWEDAKGAFVAGLRRIAQRVEAQKR